MDVKSSILRTSNRDRWKRGLLTKRESVHIILACFVTDKYWGQKAFWSQTHFPLNTCVNGCGVFLSMYTCPIPSMSVLHAGHSDSPHLTRILEVWDSKLFFRGCTTDLTSLTRWSLKRCGKRDKIYYGKVGGNLQLWNFWANTCSSFGKSGLNAKWNAGENNVMRSVLFMMGDRGKKLSLCNEFWNFEIWVLN